MKLKQKKMAAVLALKKSFTSKIRFWQAKWTLFWPCNRLSKPKSDFGKQNGRRFGLGTDFQNQNPILASKMDAVLTLQLGFKTKIQFWKAKWPPFGLESRFRNQNPILESKMAAVLALQQAFKTKIRFWQTKWPPFWP